jgi:hypothetical protein
MRTTPLGVSGEFLRWQYSCGRDDRPGHVGGARFPNQTRARQSPHGAFGYQKIITVGGVAGGMKHLPVRVTVISSVHMTAGLLWRSDVETAAVTVIIRPRNVLGWLGWKLKWHAGWCSCVRVFVFFHSTIREAG